MPGMHLNQPGFTYSDWEPFTKNKGGIQKFKETGDSRYIYKNGLDKAYFQNDMAYGYSEDLAERRASYKVSRDKHLILLDMKEVLLLWFINSSIKGPLHLKINLLQVVILKMKLHKISS